LGEALDFDASDIHLEPQEDHAVVRYRIDGKLMRRWHPIPIRFYAPLVTRLKVLGKMDITEKRKPQDGRIAIFRNKREIDFRLSTLPTRFGEKIVMRVLDRSSFLVNLNRLIVIDEVYETVRGMVNQPYGILFVAGPTGSGKTTTMYSAIMERKDEGINIVTVEDPVEYSIPGITQVQINEATNLGFSEAIRAFLRQDPDIIMVGETRDPQTARHAMTAALMGHLVFTSLHANDAIGTILRLRDIGIETFLIANAVVGTIYQRLLRRICQVCREPFDYDEDLLRRVRVDAEGKAATPVTYFRGRGCHACNGTGFRGRIAAYEVLRINEELRHLVSIGAETSKIREAARHA
ncbi:MAG: type II/IV secretion system protein, partial [Deltaproteobacteria bacterium]